MKLFLDDTRPFPDKKCGFCCARDYEHCISLIDIAKGKIDYISLDYDLGSVYTGLDVLKYMNENQILPKQINIHSTHMFGSRKMEEYVKAHFQGSILTTEKQEKDR